MLGRIGQWLLKRGVASQHERERREREARRVELRAAAFPVAWEACLAEIPHARRLTPEQRTKWLGDIQVFLGEKKFVGMDGFVVDDRVKVIVAGSAALLVLGRDISLFDHVERIVLYHELEEREAGGYYHQQHHMLDGESVLHSGSVDLAWKHVTRGFSRADGQNVALHEFAHAFDDADGKLDALMSHANYDRWRALLRDLPLHRRIHGNYEITEVIGDVDGPELFASATELFFERPHELHDLDRDLFEALRAIYAIDPRQLMAP